MSTTQHLASPAPNQTTRPPTRTNASTPAAPPKRVSSSSSSSRRTSLAVVARTLVLEPVDNPFPSEETRKKLQPQDAADLLLMACAQACIQADNRALCPKEIAELMLTRGWKPSGSQPFALVSSCIRTHVRKALSANPPYLPIFAAYDLTGPVPPGDELGMGISKGGKSAIKRGTLWYLSEEATGVKNHFNRPYPCSAGVGHPLALSVTKSVTQQPSILTGGPVPVQPTPTITTPDYEEEDDCLGRGRRKRKASSIAGGHDWDTPVGSPSQSAVSFDNFPDPRSQHRRSMSSVDAAFTPSSSVNRKIKLKLGSNGKPSRVSESPPLMRHPAPEVVEEEEFDEAEYMAKINEIEHMKQIQVLKRQRTQSLGALSRPPIDFHLDIEPTLVLTSASCTPAPRLFESSSPFEFEPQRQLSASLSAFSCNPAQSPESIFSPTTVNSHFLHGPFNRSFRGLDELHMSPIAPSPERDRFDGWAHSGELEVQSPDRRRASMPNLPAEESPEADYANEMLQGNFDFSFSLESVDSADSSKARAVSLEPGYLNNWRSHSPFSDMQESVADMDMDEDVKPNVQDDLDLTVEMKDLVVDDDEEMANVPKIKQEEQDASDALSTSKSIPLVVKAASPALPEATPKSTSLKPTPLTEKPLSSSRAGNLDATLCPASSTPAKIKSLHDNARRSSTSSIATLTSTRASAASPLPSSKSLDSGSLGISVPLPPLPVLPLATLTGLNSIFNFVNEVEASVTTEGDMDEYDLMRRTSRATSTTSESASDSYFESSTSGLSPNYGIEYEGDYPSEDEAASEAMSPRDSEVLLGPESVAMEELDSAYEPVKTHPQTRSGRRFRAMNHILGS